MTKMIILLNCKAGSAGEELKAKLAAAFDSHNLKPEIIISSSAATLRQSIKTAIDSQPQVIVAGGGDGTISAVAAAVAGSQITLGVLPLGTLNHFSKDLKLPQKLEAAVAVIANNHVDLIDYATINGRPFINNSSLGIYPSIVRRREADEPKLGKWLAAALALWRTFQSYQNYSITLKVDGKDLNYVTPLIFVGNNDYRIEKIGISSRQSLAAGHLCVYIARPTRTQDWLGLVWCMLLGKLENQNQFDAFYPQTVTVKTNYQSLRLAVDGEVVSFKAPFNYAIHSAGLRVLVKKTT